MGGCTSGWEGSKQGKFPPPWAAWPVGTVGRGQSACKCKYKAMSIFKLKYKIKKILRSLPGAHCGQSGQTACKYKYKATSIFKFKYNLAKFTFGTQEVKVPLVSKHNPAV